MDQHHIWLTSMFSPNSFEWPRSKKGYFLAAASDVIPVGGDDLVRATLIPSIVDLLPEESEPRAVVQQGGEVEKFAPLHEFKGLFREFAHLDCNDDEVKSFAGRYGLLYTSWDYRYAVELLQSWYTEILKMSFATRLLVQGDKPRTHTKLVDFFNNVVILDPVYRFSPSLVRSELTGRAEMQLLPSNLISAMWLQFASAATGEVTYRKCEECPTWFPVAPGDGRPEKVFCSNACQMRAYRKRKSAKAKRTDKPSMGPQER